MVDADNLLAAYDAQLRAYIPDPLPSNMSVERDGPLLRWFVADGGRGWVVYRDLGGLEGDALDELIARQITTFGERGVSFEWKTHGHDRPADLPERLRAAGFVPQEPETIVIGDVAAIAAPPQLPEGVALHEVTARRDLDRIAAMEERVWGDNHSWLPRMLEAERVADPEVLAILAAIVGDDVVCAGWARFPRGTDFATLWGGATLPEWRRRGIYRATVAYRANLAAARGRRYLEVDASDESRPILERLSFTAVTTSTPYIWSPQAAR